MLHQLSREDYFIVWICVHAADPAVAQKMLDEEHGDLKHDFGDYDKNLHTVEFIAGHNAETMALPVGWSDNNQATNAAMQTKATIKKIQLMMRIGGGAPSANTGIRRLLESLLQPWNLIACTLKSIITPKMIINKSYAATREGRCGSNIVSADKRLSSRARTRKK